VASIVAAMKRLLLLPFASLLLTATALAEDKAPSTTVAKSAEAAKVQDITPDQAERLLKENKEAVVLDIRTTEEFKEGHIAGATNLDFLEDDFSEKIAKLDPNKPYILHCASGGRSSKALQKLKDAKIGTIYHMNGGIKAWEQAGKPLQK
jgi:rhodanese-related sulfurtransferase